MIAEAIDYVKKLAQEAVKPTVLHVPGDPEHVHYIVESDGSLTRHTSAEHPRFIKLENLSDLIAMGRDHFDGKVQDESKMVVFYWFDAVELVFNFTNGWERARVQFSLSQEYEWFQARLDTAKPAPLTPAEFRDALRTTLSKCLPDTKLIDQVSSLGAKTVEDGSTSTFRGRESLGVSIAREIHQPEKMPDERQVFQVRRYSNPELDFRFPIEFVLDPDLATKRWKVFVAEDILRKFSHDTLDSIGTRLREGFKGTEIRVFAGRFETNFKPCGH